MDEIDRAQEREAQDLALALKQRKPQLQPCGICYNCTDPVPGMSEFCDEFCRDDYEAREAALERAGR